MGLALPGLAVAGTLDIQRRRADQLRAGTLGLRQLNGEPIDARPVVGVLHEKRVTMRAIDDRLNQVIRADLFRSGQQRHLREPPHDLDRRLLRRIVNDHDAVQRPGLAQEGLDRLRKPWLAPVVREHGQHLAVAVEARTDA